MVLWARTAEIHEERQRIISLKDQDQQRYLKEMITWNVNRLAELQKNGWRKAQGANS